MAKDEIPETLADLAGAIQKHIVGLERKLNQFSALASAERHYSLANAAKYFEGKVCEMHAEMGTAAEDHDGVIWQGQTRRGGR